MSQGGVHHLWVGVVGGVVVGWRWGGLSDPQTTQTYACLNTKHLPAFQTHMLPAKYFIDIYSYQLCSAPTYILLILGTCLHEKSWTTFF